MAFRIVDLHIRAHILVLCLLSIFVRACNGNVTNSSTFGGDRICKTVLAVEHGIIHVNGNDVMDSADQNECITAFQLSSVNDTHIDVVEENIPSSTSTTSISQEKGDKSSTNPTTIMMKTHMNIGFGELQLIQHDREATQQRLIETLLYMYNNHTSSTTTTSSGTEVECNMQHELCAYWAASGECDARPGTSTICESHF